MAKHSSARVTSDADRAVHSFARAIGAYRNWWRGGPHYRRLYPEAGITPAIGDPLRGPYLRWLFFYGSSYEPALIDRSMKRELAPPSTSPYGTYDTMLQTLGNQLGDGPYLLGERFTAADVLWGMALRWTTMFKLVPETPASMAYIERVTSRPAALRAEIGRAHV